ncbi:hypothetical protein LINPERHAP2_LOCUS13922 [Linum perenne]
MAPLFSPRALQQVEVSFVTPKDGSLQPSPLILEDARSCVLSFGLPCWV